MRTPGLAILAMLSSGVPAFAPPAVGVCEHGNVKSVVAMELFNRFAQARGSKLRGVSRGMQPEAGIPAPIAARLKEDGFDVGGFEPAPWTKTDLPTAPRVVAIGTDTSSVTSSASVIVEEWQGIPPASERYEASRDALRRRIEALLAELEKPGPGR